MTSWPLFRRRDHGCFVRNPGRWPPRRSGSDWFTGRNGGVRDPEMRLPGIVVSMTTAPLALVLYSASRSSSNGYVPLPLLPSSRVQIDRKGREGETHPHSADLSSLSLHPPGEPAASWKTVALGRNYSASIRVLFILYVSLPSRDQRDQSPLHIVGC
ncbi:MFS transporter [Colletotrichum graminicola]|nr:MFS transporter [Colletotrichum graminicola]